MTSREKIDYHFIIVHNSIIDEIKRITKEIKTLEDQGLDHENNAILFADLCELEKDVRIIKEFADGFGRLLDNIEKVKERRKNPDLYRDMYYSLKKIRLEIEAEKKEEAEQNNKNKRK